MPSQSRASTLVYGPPTGPSVAEYSRAAVATRSTSSRGGDKGRFSAKHTRLGQRDRRPRSCRRAATRRTSPRRRPARSRRRPRCQCRFRRSRFRAGPASGALLYLRTTTTVLFIIKKKIDTHTPRARDAQRRIARHDDAVHCLDVVIVVFGVETHATFFERCLLLVANAPLRVQLVRTRGPASKKEIRTWATNSKCDCGRPRNFDAMRKAFVQKV